MRLSEPETLFTLFLYALPVVVAWLRLGLLNAFLVTVLVAIAGMVIRMRTVLEPPDPQRVELHTITYSHYVEKARWCLDRTGIAYTEVPSVGILGVLLTSRTVPLLVVPYSRASIGDSPAILRYLWGTWSAVLPAERTRFLAPSAEALALEKHFDEALGVNVRLWSYWHLLRQRDLTLLMWGAEEPSIPQWQKWLLPRAAPLFGAVLKQVLGITDAKAAAGLEATKKVFAEVDAMLADGRRYLMGGDELTFVDITFASLAALALFPDNYTGRDVYAREAPVSRLAPVWRSEVEALRATAAGRFALRLYAEERLSARSGS